jgi:hypothetical protein
MAELLMRILVVAAVREDPCTFSTGKYFQGGWALVAEQLPYACGAASILLDRAMGLSDDAA